MGMMGGCVKMKNKLRVAVILMIVLLLPVLFSCKTESEDEDGHPKWAGVRVSSYGMEESYGDRFPDTNTMTWFGTKMTSCFDKSKAAYIIIVGVMGDDEKTCHLQFPLSKEIQNAYGDEEDFYEKYLTALDAAGASVWLQVEPGNADLVELAKEIMNRYKHHSCVKGFGIDVEWYKPEGTRRRGTKLDNATARKVLAEVRKVKQSYTVFVKHWDGEWLPSAMDGLIYVNDSQDFHPGKDSTALERMVKEFSNWAITYAPQPVMFQIGYENDRDNIWGSMTNPVKELGTAIAEGCTSGNDMGIIWVDFTLKEAMRKIK